MIVRTAVIFRRKCVVRSLQLLIGDITRIMYVAMFLIDFLHCTRGNILIVALLSDKMNLNYMQMRDETIYSNFLIWRRLLHIRRVLLIIILF